MIHVNALWNWCEVFIFTMRWEGPVLHFVLMDASYYHMCYVQMSVDGWCSNSTLLNDGDVVFAYDWCPYQYAWLCIIGLALYLLCFSPGEELQSSNSMVLFHIWISCCRDFLQLLDLTLYWDVDRHGSHAMDYQQWNISRMGQSHMHLYNYLHQLGLKPGSLTHLPNPHRSSFKAW